MRPNFQGSLSPLPPRAMAAPNVRQDVAAYRILKMCYLDDVACFDGDIVYWPDEPNKEMEPLNDLARDATNAFFDKIEQAAIEACAAKGTRYIPLRRPIEEERAMNSADARRVEIIKGDGGVPVLGGRSRGRVQKATALGPEEQPIADLTRRGRKAANAISDQ